MIRLDTQFPILHDGKETTAEIIGVFVHEEDIFMPVIIISTGEIKVYQIMPNGLKDAGEKKTDLIIGAVMSMRDNKEKELFIAR